VRCFAAGMYRRFTADPQNKNVQKALIAAEYAGVTIEEPAFEYGVTNKTEAFKKLTPIGKVIEPSSQKKGALASPHFPCH